jgi:hypothetical protein
MTKKTYIIAIALLFISLISNAQNFTTIIPANTIIINKDTNLYLGNANLGTQLDSNILICGDWTVNLSGQSTHIPRIYLEETAHLVIVDTNFFCFWSDIFMKSNTTYDHNRHQCGVIDSIIKMPTAVLSDTGLAVQYLVPITNLIFDYSLLPGGVAPCPSAFPNTTNNISKFNTSITVQNPIRNELRVNNINATNFIIKVYDVTGKEVIKQTIKQGINHYNVQHLQNGIYIYKNIDKNTVIQNEKLIY